MLQAQQVVHPLFGRGRANIRRTSGVLCIRVRLDFKLVFRNVVDDDKVAVFSYEDGFGCQLRDIQACLDVVFASDETARHHHSLVVPFAIHRGNSAVQSEHPIELKVLNFRFLRCCQTKCAIQDSSLT